MKRKYFPLILLAVVISLTGFIPSSPVLAEDASGGGGSPGGLPFGGLVSFPLPCTCAPGFVAVWFTPLYLGGPVLSSGFLVYSPPTSIPYSFYKIAVPLTWHLGSYVPGVQACLMLVPHKPCAPLPSFGLITRVGTSLLP